MVVRAQFVESRDFCWAPHTTQVQYTLAVDVKGRRLTDAEASQRYRQWQYGWEAHSYHNLIDVITQYEQTYGKADEAQIRLESRINGNDPHLWT